MRAEPKLYLWFDRDPAAFPPDQAIPDVPGTADIDLLSSAILNGELGTLLPARISMSTRPQPESPRSIRTIDVGRLLRELGVNHRRCYQIDLPESNE